MLLAAAVLASGSAGAATADSFPGQSRKWVYYQSPNFELYGANGDRTSRDILEKLELLRAVVLDTFKLKVRLPQPVTIYSFDREKEFNSYLPPDRRKGDVQWAGFCRSDLDRTVIILAPAADREATEQVVFHEYIHYLFRITEQRPPPWFNEGVAELYSTMQEDGQWLDLGQPIAGWIPELRQGELMPFNELFGVTDDSPIFQNSSHTGKFYAQSWAFLHFCCFGLNGIPPDKMNTFLRVAGSPKTQALGNQFEPVCRELLDLDYPGLRERLRAYVEIGRFQGRRVPRPQIAAKSGYSARPAADGEMATRLAELSLRFAHEPYANWYILDRAEHGADSRICELLGAMALQKGENDVAREQWTKAMNLGSANAAVYHELGRLEVNVLLDSFNLDSQLTPERTDRLRQLLTKSIKCAPDQSTAYEQLAWVEAATAKPSLANVNLVQKQFASLTNQPLALLALIIVRWRLGDTPAVLHLLDSLDKMNPAGWVAYWAETVRARAENRPPDRARLDKLRQKPTAPFRLELPKLDLSR